MIKIYVASYGVVGQEVTVGVMICDNFGNSFEKILPLTTKSKYVGELLGIQYALSSITKNDVNVEVITSMAHIPQLFVRNERGVFSKRTKPNHLVTSVRKLSLKFTSFNCSYSDHSNQIIKLKSRIKELLSKTK